MLGRYALSALFVTAGALHFVYPDTYAKIVPPRFPAPNTLVALSGLAEVLGGAGILVPKTRRLAGVGLIALLIAVFPANLYMAVDAQDFAALAPAWALYARLPLQLVLIYWVQRTTR